jgi:hypothetical protein
MQFIARFMDLTKGVFKAYNLAFLALLLGLVSVQANAQVTDTIYQKPSLNNGMPPAEVSPPVIIQEPKKQVTKPDSAVVKSETKVKEYKEPVPIKDRFFTGGGFGLSFGTYTNVQLAPILGFKVTDWFAAGVGLTYIYIGDAFSSENFIGKKVFLQGQIYKGVFAHAEYENFSSLSEKYSVNATLAGAGYRQMISNKVGLDLMLLLNLDQSTRSAYADPLIYRFGFYIEL